VGFHWSTHSEVALYVLLALFLFYFPAKTAKGLGQFIERHFGDAVGFYILHLGIILVVIAGVYPQVSGVKETGSSLILAGMVALKLKTTSPPDTTISSTVTNTSTSAAATASSTTSAPSPSSPSLSSPKGPVTGKPF
jgi:hypothetical protein